MRLAFAVVDLVKVVDVSEDEKENVVWEVHEVSSSSSSSIRGGSECGLFNTRCIKKRVPHTCKMREFAPDRCNSAPEDMSDDVQGGPLVRSQGARREIISRSVGDHSASAFGSGVW